MAKKNHNYGVSPWELTKGAIDNFVLVTEANRKNAITLGRIYYFIEPSGSKFIFLGANVIRPLLKKGYWNWPHYPWAVVPKDVQNKTHWRQYYDKDEDYTEWKDFFDKIITDGINKKTLYICPKDEILKFYQE